MGGFSIPEAAFAGFRIARERPRAVATWVVIQLILSLALGGALVAVAGPDLMRLRDAGALLAAGSGETLALVRRLAPVYGLIVVFSLAFSPLLYGAMNRAVMAPPDDRFGYFRLGSDELRQFALLLLMGAVVLAAYVAWSLLAFLLAVIAALIAKPAAPLALALCLAAGAIGAIFVAVRLSLASAQTFATGKVNLFGSWALTRGRFWPILGAYVLAGALAGVVWLLWFVLTFAIVAAIGGVAGAADALRPDLSSLGAFFAPAALAQSVLGAILTALLWPVLGAPPAVIYQGLTGVQAGAAA